VRFRDRLLEGSSLAGFGSASRKRGNNNTGKEPKRNALAGGNHEGNYDEGSYYPYK
jgi:hypothetical protein